MLRSVFAAALDIDIVGVCALDGQIKIRFQDAGDTIESRARANGNLVVKSVADGQLKRYERNFALSVEVFLKVRWLEIKTRSQ